MTTICHVDYNLIYTGDKQTMPDDRQAVPGGWVATEPPKGAGIWQWSNIKWIKLDKYPEKESPVISTKIYYSPDQLILAIDSLGKTKELEDVLKEASPRIRLRWQKAIYFASDDPDFISLVKYLQESWKLSDKQKDELLLNCIAPYQGF